MIIAQRQKVCMKMFTTKVCNAGTHKLIFYRSFEFFILINRGWTASTALGTVLLLISPHNFNEAGSLTAVIFTGSNNKT
jgi:hypothetical protein